MATLSWRASEAPCLAARCVALAGSVLFALLLPASPVRAADAGAVAEVQALAAAGQAAFESGDFEVALGKYQAAHAMMALPELSYMEARSLESLGRLAEAVAVFERTLGESPDEGIRGRAEQKLSDLRPKLRSGSLLLLVEPSGAEVVVDGTVRGVAPLAPLELAPGRHVLEVRAAGYDAWTETATLEGGGTATLRVALAKSVAPARPVVADEAPSAGGAARSGRVWYENAWGWSTLAVGVVAGVSGGALLGVAEQVRSDVRSGRDAALAGTGTMSQAEAFSQRSTADTEELAGWILVGVGGAALVTSVVLFTVLDDDEPSGQGGVTVSPGVVPAGGSVTVQGRF